MTIAKTDARKQYAGDDVTTAFSFPYRFFADSDLQVYLLVDATGVETLQTLTTHYAVVNNGDETGGTVTMATEPAAGETLTILRAIPQTQGTDYAANDPFPAETHEAALDRVTLLTQQLQEEIGRALIAPASDSASVELPIDRASSFLAFDASKNPIASAGGVSDVVVSTFMATVLDDTTAAEARATLEALNEVVEDTTPQAGGPFDMNGNMMSFSQAPDVASATELLLLAAEGNIVNITGTATVATIEDTADAIPIDTIVTCRAVAACTFTHHATNLINIGGVDITFKAEDWFQIQKYASGDWRMISLNGISSTADWETGISTKPSLASPADNAAAIAKLGFTGSNSYTSSAQTVTSAGLLTLAHGLGLEPKVIQFIGECTVATDNYSIGDRIFLTLVTNSSGSSRINSVRVDSTNIYIRFTDQAQAFIGADKNTGAAFALSVAQWDLYVEAWT